MKTKILSMALISMLAFFTINCSNDDIVSSDLAEKTAQVHMTDYHFIGQQPDLMLKKKGMAVTKTIKFFEAGGPFEFDFSVDGCTPAPFLTVSGSGNASHIGLYEVINQGCYDGVSPILGTITAANGDEIHTFINSAVQDMDTGIWTYHYVVYNGTGRFYGVYGNIYLVGTLNMDTMTWNLAGEGTITY